MRATGIGIYNICMNGAGSGRVDPDKIVDPSYRRLYKAFAAIEKQ